MAGRLGIRLGGWLGWVEGCVDGEEGDAWLNFSRILEMLSVENKLPDFNN